MRLALLLALYNAIGLVTGEATCSATCLAIGFVTCMALCLATHLATCLAILAARFATFWATDIIYFSF